MKTLFNIRSYPVAIKTHGQVLISIKNLAYSITLLFLTLIFFSFQAHATHVVGGGITYTQMENNNYLITVKLYRDCSPGTAQLPGNVNVVCRRGSDGSVPPGIASLILPLVSVTQLAPSVPSCAFDPGICVQEAIYEAIVNIPPGVGGYHLYYRLCCRNGTIVNIINPLAAQETFYAYIPDNTTLQNQINSSPYFNFVPPVYVCAGEPLSVNFAANDMDGDSLVYYFYTPFDGQNNGGITYNAGTPPNNITISPVNWQPGFSASDPLDANAGFLPGLTIDNNGLISGTPPAAGQYVMGVMVDEYRNGVLIGRISRDFQFNVINCPPPLEAIIDVPSVCNGLTVNFDNLSTGNPATSWWDFGTGNAADSSIVFQPAFNYASAGTYTVTLIINKGTACADTATYQLTIMDPVVFTVDVDSVSCNGLGDGQAFASANDPSYIYDWSTLQTGPSISNLAPGNYWVKASNNIGCVDTQLFIVEEPAVLDVQFNPTQPLCNGDQNGSIEGIATGGVGPYNYFWPQQSFNGNILPNIGAGNYQVQVTDANGCQTSGNGSVSQPAMLFANVVGISNVSCYGLADGTVSVNISGGSGGYSIDWLTLANDSTYMNNLAAGVYIAEVTDANNCLAIVNANITQPDSFYVNIAVINSETCSNSNGVAFADVTNGIGIINFLWTPGGSTNDLATGLSAGPIQVNVVDENGCQAQANATLINQPTGVASIGNITPVSCQNGNDGSISVNMTGGTQPFNYNWSCACPNQSSLNNLVAGNYSVEVVDGNGCVDSVYFTINQIPTLEVQATILIAPSCNGFADGEIEAEAIGGTQPYAFSWNTQPVQSDTLAQGLTAGTYTVTVTDDNGCTAQMSAELVDPAVLIADAQILSNIICFGDSTGGAIAQGIGGTTPYNFLWIENGEPTAMIDSLPAGIYNVIVTDYNGCEAFASVDIIEYDSVYAEITWDEGFCPGDQVDFTVMTNGQNTLYSFYWFVNANLESTSNTFSTVINDTSTVMIALVSGANCPTVTDSVVVGPIMMPANNVSAFATPDTICFGSPAILQASVLDTSNVTLISWNEPGLDGLGPHTIYPTQGTDYVVTIENVCGAQQNALAHVDVFLPPSATIFAEGISSCEFAIVEFSYAYDNSYIYSFEGAYWMIAGQTYNENNPSITYNYSNQVQANLYVAFSNGCTFEYDSTIAVTVFPRPDGDFYVNPDPAIEMEEAEFIDVTYGNTQGWEWFVDGQFLSTDERPQYVFETAGEYTITQIVFDENGCSDTTDHIIEVIGTYTVFVPNAFTPDGNGLNNTFRPIVTNVDPDQYRFQIFNRWGEMIYETEVIDNSWDGIYNGEAVRDGIYIWKVLVTDNVGIEHEYVGHVTLLR